MEILEIYKRLKTTYGELEVVLKRLDYIEKRADNIIAFVNEKHDSIIRLKKKRKDAFVFPLALASETRIMYLKGVIEVEEDLTKMIQKVRADKKANKAKAAA